MDEIPSNEEIQKILKKEFIREIPEEFDNRNKLSESNTKTKIWYSSQMMDSIINVFQIEYNKGNKFILPILKSLRDTKTTMLNKMKELKK